jgi:integrase
MGSIINRDGRWRAQVRRRGFKDQCKTFATKAQAQVWVRQVESDMDGGKQATSRDTTIGDVIDAYRGLRERARPISDSSNEHYILKALKRGLGHLRLSAITPDDLVAYATMRREEGAGPYTINMDVSKLGTALRYGGSVLKIAPPDIVGASRPLLTHLRLIGGGGKRERRPTEDELSSILAYFSENHGKVWRDAVEFSAHSAMRRGEVTAIEWSDLNEETKIVSVWRKHPRKGKTLERVPLLTEAWKIVKRQPRSEGRIFPIEAGTLSKYFTWACRKLGIPDLHLHDLRHEGTSAMFEQGHTLERVALVTGHKDWRNLKRYTNLRPEDLTQQVHGKRPDVKPRRGNPRTGARRQGKS